MDAEYMYGIEKVRPSRSEADRRDKIAREEGGGVGGYVEANVRRGAAPGINGGEYLGWYTGPNLGTAENMALSRRVLRRVRAASSEASA